MCNFTREAFSKGSWDEYRSIARGLFLDPQGNVVMQGFDKFFNLGENPETTLEKVLQKAARSVLAQAKSQGRELKYYAPLLDTWKVDLTWVDVNTLVL